MRLAYRDHRGKRRRFAARQITRRPNGHQTHIVITRRELDAAAVAHAMFSRWRQGNFFRYMRRYALAGDGSRGLDRRAQKLAVSGLGRSHRPHRGTASAIIGGRLLRARAAPG